MAKPKVATTSLAGCFGCHMSILDIDERILKLVELVDFDKSPIDDIKKFTGRCAVGLIEGGCCNEENVHVLQDFRKHCDILISRRRLRDHGRHPGDAQHDPAQGVPGGGLPATGRPSTTPAGGFPTTRSCRCCWTRSTRATRWSRSTTTCPAARRRRTPSGQALVALLTGKPLELPYELIKYD